MLQNADYFQKPLQPKYTKNHHANWKIIPLRAVYIYWLNTSIYVYQTLSIIYIRIWDSFGFGVRVWLVFISVILSHPFQIQMDSILLPIKNDRIVCIRWVFRFYWNCATKTANFLYSFDGFSCLFWLASMKSEILKINTFVH